MVVGWGGWCAHIEKIESKCMGKVNLLYTLSVS
ncbi:unnamed protein product, partial [marine sediment metagenome]